MIEADLRAMAYEAHRKGSLDSDIRNRNDNDLLDLLERFSSIEAIAFNGGTTGKLGIKVLGPRAVAYEILTLPSSSPAYTLPYEDKAILWLALQRRMQLKIKVTCGDEVKWAGASQSGLV